MFSAANNTLRPLVAVRSAYFQTEQFSRIAGGCQSSEMAALLNSLSFAFANSFLPKYRVK